jgi:predicted NAD/FAD-dependent oxidoreductase
MMVAFLELGGVLPQAWTVHRWRYAEAVTYLDCGFVWDTNAKIGLCGDWLNGGKVQGAWLSGRKLAQQVINCEDFL